jgi:hypothetical protein
LLVQQKLRRSFIKLQLIISSNVLHWVVQKIHLIVLPDAKPDMTAQNITASMSGCAGQRCMGGFCNDCRW